MISELTTLELKDAPQEVQDIIREIPKENIDYEELTEEAVNLARKYIVEGVIGEGKSVNLKYGYPLLEIRSPLEVITYEE